MREKEMNKSGIQIPAPENKKVVLTAGQVLQDFDFGLEEMLETASMTNEIDKASPANPDTAQASVYQAPKTL